MSRENDEQNSRAHAIKESAKMAIYWMEKEKEEAKLADEARQQWLAEEVRKAAEETEKERKAADEETIQTTETSSQESTSTYYTAYDSEYFSQQK
jgi:hypothetical protein